MVLPSINLAAMGACAIICIAIPNVNDAKISFPYYPLYSVRMDSTDIARRTVYNNGNITFCLDGGAVMNTALQESYNRISEIRDLPDNWNENGASKFSNEILDTLKQIVESLKMQPEIFPTARDSIQLEYENENGDYLEFELFEGGRLKKFFCSHDDKTETKDIPIGLMNEEVDKFYAL